MESIKFISASQVKNVLAYKQLIPKMEEALAKFSSKKVVQPVRSVLHIKETDGFVEFYYSGNFASYRVSRNRTAETRRINCTEHGH